MFKTYFNSSKIGFTGVIFIFQQHLSVLLVILVILTNQQPVFLIFELGENNCGSTFQRQGAVKDSFDAVNADILDRVYGDCVCLENKSLCFDCTLNKRDRHCAHSG